MSSQDSSNALRYRELLKKPADGTCLWFPSEDAAVGSVGYLRDGEFVTLFNAFSPLNGLPALSAPIGPPDLVTRTRPNNRVAWMSRAESGCTLHFDGPVSLEAVNIGVTVDRQTAEGAFLVPGGEQHRVKTLFADRHLVLYLFNNVDAISRLYPNHQISTLMILRGTTHTNGYVRGLLRSSHREGGGRIAFSPLGTEMFSLGIAGNATINNHWLIQTEPTNLQNQSNSIYKHCIIVKPVLLRKRDSFFLRLRSMLGISTEDAVHSGPTPTPTANPSSQQALTGPSMSASVVPSTMTALADVLDLNAIHDHGAGDDDDMDDDEKSLSENIDPPDDFEALLDAALAAHPEIDTVIADWDVLHAFWQQHGNDLSSGNDGLSFDLEVIGDGTDGRVAQLRGISSLRETQSTSPAAALPNITALSEGNTSDIEPGSATKYSGSKPVLVDNSINRNFLSMNYNPLSNNNANTNFPYGAGTIINNNLNMNYFPLGSENLDDIQTRISSALRTRFVPNAAFEAQLGSGCMEGTRVQILRSIENWIKDPNAPSIFWLTGFAGSGKTAIDQTVCSRARDDPDIILGGSFFCSRWDGSAAQRDIRCVIPTLVQSLARLSPEFAKALAAELQRDPDILHKHIKAQIEQLLYKPLLALKDSPVPVLFVIDALDECRGQLTDDGTLDDAETHRVVSDMLTALVDFSRSAVKVPVKFLISSRPEMHIRDTPVSDNNFSKILRLHTVDTELVTADILLYINARLASPGLRTRFTDADTYMLARFSDKLFIVATTALRYILSAGVDMAISRFRTLFNSARDGLSTMATARLDHMYILVLEVAITASQADLDELQAMLEPLASLVSARMALSVTALASLLGVTCDVIRARLSRLHSVVHVPDYDDEPSLGTLHSSFDDYLIGRAPNDIRISASLGHDLLARGCLRVMAEQLHFNVSQSSFSYEPNPPMRPGMITASLEYACLQWAYHVASLQDVSALDEDIYHIFCPRLLFWLEVMSILGRVGHAAAMLLFASENVRSSPLAQFLRDANAFIMSSYEAIQRSAPHIYLSALPFAAKSSLVYQSFAPLCTGLISVDTFGIDQHGGRLRMTLAGHEQGVTSVVYSPDGRLIGSGSGDGTVCIWDTRSGEEMMMPLHSGDGAVISVAYAPNGKKLAAGTEAGSVCMWTLLAGQAHLRRLMGHIGAVRSVSFSPDGAMLASASEDMSVRLWEAETGVQVAVLNGHTGKAIAVAFSSDGATLASSSEDRTIRLWNVTTREAAGQLLDVDHAVLTICFSPDGRTLASGDTQGVVKFWDFQTGTTVLTLHDHSDQIRCVQFSPDGRSLVSTSNDRTVRNWTIPENIAGVSLIVLTGYTGYVCSASFSPNGLYIASASDDCTIRIWDAGRGQPAVQPLPAHGEDVHSATVSSSGRFVVSGSGDRSVRVWDAQTGEPRLSPLLGHTEIVWSVNISSDERLIASASADLTLRLWNPRTGEAVGDPLTGHEDKVNAVAFSPDTRWLASGSDDRTVRLWDVSTRQPPNIALLHCTGEVFTVAFSPDGRQLAAGDSSGRIYIWHTNTGQLVYEPLHANRRDIISIAFSADGARIVAGGGDTTVRVWDVKTGEQIIVLGGHTDSVSSVACSTDGRFISSGSDDCTVRLWDASTGALLTTLHSQGTRVRSVAFTPNGQSIISCSGKTIRVWDVESALALSSETDGSILAALASSKLKDGWVLSPSGELLLWAPAEYRDYLQAAPCRLLIGERRIVINTNSDDLQHGENWTACWRGTSY